MCDTLYFSSPFPSWSSWWVWASSNNVIAVSFYYILYSTSLSACTMYIWKRMRIHCPTIIIVPNIYHWEEIEKLIQSSNGNDTAIMVCSSRSVRFVCSISVFLGSSPLAILKRQTRQEIIIQCVDREVVFCVEGEAHCCYFLLSVGSEAPIYISHIWKRKKPKALLDSLGIVFLL